MSTYAEAAIQQKISVEPVRSFPPRQSYSRRLGNNRILKPNKNHDNLITILPGVELSEGGSSSASQQTESYHTGGSSQMYKVRNNDRFSTETAKSGVINKKKPIYNTKNQRKPTMSTTNVNNNGFSSNRSAFDVPSGSRFSPLQSLQWESEVPVDTLGPTSTISKNKSSSKNRKRRASSSAEKPLLTKTSRSPMTVKKSKPANIDSSGPGDDQSVEEQYLQSPHQRRCSISTKITEIRTELNASKPSDADTFQPTLHSLVTPPENSFSSPVIILPLENKIPSVESDCREKLYFPTSSTQGEVLPSLVPIESSAARIEFDLSPPGKWCESGSQESASVAGSELTLKSSCLSLPGSTSPCRRLVPGNLTFSSYLPPSASRSSIPSASSASVIGLGSTEVEHSVSHHLPNLFLPLPILQTPNCLSSLASYDDDAVSSDCSLPSVETPFVVHSDPDVPTDRRDKSRKNPKKKVKSLSSRNSVGHFLTTRKKPEWKN
jgi:hypothetical protein